MPRCILLPVCRCHYWGNVEEKWCQEEGGEERAGGPLESDFGEKKPTTPCGLRRGTWILLFYLVELVDRFKDLFRLLIDIFVMNLFVQ